MVKLFLLTIMLTGSDAGIVDNISLVDVAGGRHSLHDLASKGGVVLYYLGTECPLSRRYAPKIEEIWKSYRDRNIQVIGVSASEQDSQAKVVRFGKEFGLTFPLVKDAALELTRQLQATRNSEVFLIDSSFRVRYQGRIDDQYTLAQELPTPTRLDLTVAIEEILSGQEVKVSRTDAVGCRIGRSLKEDPNPTAVWYPEVAEIVRKHCVACHRIGGTAPFPLTRYEDIEGWGESILEAVQSRRMPPWTATQSDDQFSNGNALNRREIDRIESWVQEGCAKGDSSKDKYPAPPSSDWQLSSEPDLVFSTEEIEIPAQRLTGYRWFQVETGLETTGWASELEIRPSNRPAVRKVAVFVVPLELARAYPNMRDLIGSIQFYDHLLAWYTPGAGPTKYAEGIAHQIPAGSTIVFQVLYRPTGKVERDQTSIGIKLAKGSDHRQARYLALMAAGDSGFIDSMGNAQRDRRLAADGSLLSIIPNVSRDARSILVNVKPPAGAAKTLVHIPENSFYWQPAYRLREPLPMSSGELLDCSASFVSPVDPDIDGDRPVIVANLYPDREMITYFEIVDPLKPAPAVAKTQGVDPTGNISMAIAGLATTTLICSFILWLKPAGKRAPPPQASPAGS